MNESAESLEWDLPKAPAKTAAKAEDVSEAVAPHVIKRALLIAEYTQKCKELPPKLREKGSPLREFGHLSFPDGRIGLRVVVDFPPFSTNNLYNEWVNRKTFRMSRRMQDPVRQYKTTLVLDLLRRMGDTAILGYFASDFIVHMPYRGKGDLANHEKLPTDALMIAIANDDTRMVDLHMQREFDPTDPRIEVVIAQVPPPTYDETEQKKAAKLEKAELKVQAALTKAATPRKKRVTKSVADPAT